MNILSLVYKTVFIFYIFYNTIVVIYSIYAFKYKFKHVPRIYAHNYI